MNKTWMKFLSIEAWAANQIDSQNEGTPHELLMRCEQDMETLMMRYIAYRVLVDGLKISEASVEIVNIARILDNDLWIASKKSRHNEADI